MGQKRRENRGTTREKSATDQPPPFTVSDEVLSAVAQQLRAAPPIHSEIPGFEAFTLCACLQLAWRHPGLSEIQRAILEKATRDLQAAVAARSPVAGELLMHGWDPRMDVRG